MKKNISINIFGTIYSIDEDAYELLDNYLESMKNYFRKLDGGDEIADDIEHRVAELLWQHKEQGMTAVDIETVKEIINKIGTPVDIEGGSAEQDEDAQAVNTGNTVDTEQFAGDTVLDKMMNFLRNHRLYRNTDNKLLGGVCSGICEYFGAGDVTVWRIVIVLIGFFASSAFFDVFPVMLLACIYAILWIVVPEAKTPEDRLRMRGKKVTPDNLKEQIVRDSSKRPEGDSKAKCGSSGCGCLGLIGKFILVIILLNFIGILISALSAAFSYAMYSLGFTTIVELSSDALWIKDVIDICGETIWIVLAAAVVLAVLPIYLLVRAIRGSAKPLSRSVLLTMILAWVAAFAVLIWAVIYTGGEVTKYTMDKNAKESTRNGIVLSSPDNWRDLDNLGWELTAMDNVEPDVTHRCSAYGGLPGRSLRIRRENSAKPMSITLTRRDYVDGGKFVLEGLVAIEGRGAEITVSDSTGVALTSVTSFAKGKEIGKLTWEEGSRLPILFYPDSTKWKDFAKEDKGKWTYFVSEPFTCAGGEIAITVNMKDRYLNKCDIRHIQMRKIE